MISKRYLKLSDIDVVTKFDGIIHRHSFINKLMMIKYIKIFNELLTNNQFNSQSHSCSHILPISTVKKNKMPVCPHIYLRKFFKACVESDHPELVTVFMQEWTYLLTRIYMLRIIYNYDSVEKRYYGCSTNEYFTLDEVHIFLYEKLSKGWKNRNGADGSGKEQQQPEPNLNKFNEMHDHSPNSDKTEDSAEADKDKNTYYYCIKYRLKLITDKLRNIDEGTFSLLVLSIIWDSYIRSINKIKTVNKDINFKDINYDDFNLHEQLKLFHLARQSIGCLVEQLGLNDFLRHVLTFLDSAMELNLFYLKTKLDDKEK